MPKLLAAGGILDLEWHPLDGVPAPEYIPPVWDGPHVGQRLMEAFRTLSRLPGGPGGDHGCKAGLWPEYEYEWKEMQSADPNVRTKAANAQNRTRLMPSAEDITRMETAIVWPARYIDGIRARRLVQRVALGRSRDLDLDAISRRVDMPPSRLRLVNRDALDTIAAGLRRDSVAVF